uniref:Peroxidase n=1 Tax=Kalanchoe fedtschenkoi TaxID=63787 RepID=A0A7N0T394_KALFE
MCFFWVVKTWGQAPAGLGQLDYDFYRDSCPHLPMIVRFGVHIAMRNDSRIAASLLRLHFHDCFVNGCDGSILLDGNEDFEGEKNAFPNRKSVRGFEVIDYIKADVERVCPEVVSCVDILTLAARESVLLSGGPFWPVPLGRRDGVTASEQTANQDLPSPLESLEDITAKFTSKGLSVQDLVVLSGAHTLGFAQCFTFKHRLFNFKGTGGPDPTLDSSLLSNLRTSCGNGAKTDSKLNPLDASSAYRFDNAFYSNLMSNAGLLESDQALMTDKSTASMVSGYSKSPFLFGRHFGESMIRLGRLGVITHPNGQIRRNCRFVN